MVVMKLQRTIVIYHQRRLHGGSSSTIYSATNAHGSSDNNYITAPEMSSSVENITAITMSVVLSIELENWMIVAPLERGEKPNARLR